MSQGLFGGGNSGSKCSKALREGPLQCTIWDDVRTYLTSTIDPKEKAALLAAIAHFRKEEEQ